MMKKLPPYYQLNINSIDRRQTSPIHKLSGSIISRSKLSSDDKQEEKESQEAVQFGSLDHHRRMDRSRYVLCVRNGNG